MQPSMFNLRVPLPARDEVFLMNTLTDAQLVVSPDVAALLDRAPSRRAARTTGRRGARRARPARARTGSSSRAATPIGRRSTATSRRSRATPTELHVTVLTTLQCNFACDYCFQGDHGDYNKFAEKMSLETAARVADWIERELDRVRPERLVLTFFGGEPLLNLPVMYDLAERMWAATQARGVRMMINIITNGLLLTPEVVDRLLPFGLKGDQDHARRRPRHAQPDASAARRPGHVRSDHREHPAGRRRACRSRSAATSTRARSTAIRRCSTSCASRTSPTSS